MRGRKINWETVIITLGAAIIVSGSTLGATKITGHQNSRDLDKNLTALAQSSDKAELREVIDQAEVAIVHATSAWVALNEVSPTPPPGGPLRLSATLRAQQK